MNDELHFKRHLRSACKEAWRFKGQRPHCHLLCFMWQSSPSEVVNNDLTFPLPGQKHGDILLRPPLTYKLAGHAAHWLFWVWVLSVQKFHIFRYIPITLEPQHRPCGSQLGQMSFHCWKYAVGQKDKTSTKRNTAQQRSDFGNHQLTSTSHCS